MKINSLYITVENMKRAVVFYTNFFKKSPSHLDKRFTIFDISGITFALYNPKIDGENIILGNNCVINIEVKDIKKEYNKLKNLSVEILGKVEKIDNCFLFQFKDTEGNIIELYEEIK